MGGCCASSEPPALGDASSETVKIELKKVTDTLQSTTEQLSKAKSDLVAANKQIADKDAQIKS